jgi:hypothetical protein
MSPLRTRLLPWIIALLRVCVASDTQQFTRFRGNCSDSDCPYRVLIPLPARIPNDMMALFNPFNLTIGVTRPVVYVALEDVVKKRILPDNALVVNFIDTRGEEGYGLYATIKEWTSAHTVLLRMYCPIPLQSILLPFVMPLQVDENNSES